MPVESVTTPKRIQLVYQNLAKNAKEKIEQEGFHRGSSLLNLLLLLKIQLVALLI